MIRKYLDISTGHISEKNSNQILNTKGEIFSGVYGYPYKYGTMIKIGELDEEVINNMVNFAPEFVVILNYCKSNGINMINFDNDAPEFLEFDIFYW